MSAAFLGIDVGTSGCKALLLGADGSVVGTHTVPYGFEQPREGWAEQDPILWKEGAAKAVKTLLADHKVEILCVGLSGQMHGMTALDASDSVIRPAILWNDQRNAIECEEITAMAGGFERLVAYVSNQMLPGFTGGKIRWFSKHEPDAFEKTRIILNPKDYLRLLMTGEKATEVTDASGTGLFNVAKRRWSDELISAMQLDFTLLPPVLESADIAGRVSQSGADIFGIPVGTAVIAGGGDAIIQTLGSGVVLSGQVQTTLGTAGIVAAPLDAPLGNVGGRVQVSCNVLPDKWHCMGVSLNAGSALSWWRDIQAANNRKLPDYDDLSAMAAQVPVGADGMLFLPYLMGERCPWPDPHARGAFIGLRSHHTLAHMHRAVFEGIVYSLREMASLVSPETARASRLIHASGGGSSSAFWNQMQADVFDAPVVTTCHSSHGGAFGAALLAGIGAGHWSGPEDVAAICQQEQRWEPSPMTQQRYDAYFSCYETLYKTLHVVNKDLSKLQAEQ